MTNRQERVIQDGVVVVKTQRFDVSSINSGVHLLLSPKKWNTMFFEEKKINNFISSALHDWMNSEEGFVDVLQVLNWNAGSGLCKNLRNLLHHPAKNDKALVRNDTDDMDRVGL